MRLEGDDSRVSAWGLRLASLIGLQGADCTSKHPRSLRHLASQKDCWKKKSLGLALTPPVSVPRRLVHRDRSRYCLRDLVQVHIPCSLHRHRLAVISQHPPPHIAQVDATDFGAKPRVGAAALVGWVVGAGFRKFAALIGGAEMLAQMPGGAPPVLPPSLGLEPFGRALSSSGASSSRASGLSDLIAA